MARVFKETRRRSVILSLFSLSNIVYLGVFKFYIH